MIDGENEKKDDINQPSNHVPSQNSYQESPRDSYQENHRPPIQEPPRGSYQQPPAKSSKKTPILIIVAIIAICCVVAGVAVFIGAIALPDWGSTNNDTTSGDEPEYYTETYSGYTFKIPNGYVESDEGEDYLLFKNASNKYITISTSGTDKSIDEWVDYYETLLDQDAKKVDINEKTAYKFYAGDLDTEYNVYSYLIELEGTVFWIMISEGVSNPDNFLENVINDNY